MASAPFLLLLFFGVIVLDVAAVKQTYLVQMKGNQRPASYDTHRDWYEGHLQSLSVDPSESLLYAYDAAYNGFAVSLEPEQADALSRSDAVLGVYEEAVYQLHTTRTPLFLGLETQTGQQAVGMGMGMNQASEDVIVGVLDTGVWPESPSFNDLGMPEVPSRWRGECEAGVDFSPRFCNNKLVGARSFSKGFRMAMAYKGEKPKENESARDVDGHGTHTASTAAGAHVANASLFGYASGIARGMAPRARVAAYKVCWATGCFGSDILAGMDAAIVDGVDVLSLSLGGGSAPFYRDTIAIGAFSATARGIFVACSAGNSGPQPATLANTAPWIATVGAGTLDRDFPAYALLGNGKKYVGVSLYSGKGRGKLRVPIFYKPPGADANPLRNNSSTLCLPGSLDRNLVKGKVVLCDRGVNARVEKGLVVKEAGGVGMILANTAASGEEMVADSHLLPAVAVGRKIGDEIRKYVSSARNPTAVLSFGGTVLNVHPSPVVAAFSSRGPNMVTPEILKPDVIGPGVNILAGWSEAVGPTGLVKDKRKTLFNIMSGTSMSCPHISGVAALLKAAHPEWSPSAIKSALMTTAYNVDNTKTPLRDAGNGAPSTPLSHGAGHVDPQKALSPGLVYDISTQDYVRFLCSLNYTLDHVRAVAKIIPDVTCPRRRAFSGPGSLNYPSFSVVFQGYRGRLVKYGRQLTNVGPPGSVYEVSFGGSPNVGLKIRPQKLVFSKTGEKLKYSATFVSGKGVKPSTNDFGWIMWSNKQHQVRSPVAYTWK